MMDWQWIAALVMIVAAFVYLLHGLWRTFRGVPSGCGTGCGSCSSGKNSDESKRSDRISLPLR